MFDDVRRIRLEEINKTLTPLVAQRDAALNPIFDLDGQISMLQIQHEYETVPVKNFSFLQKHLTRRQEYKRYTEKVAEYEGLPGRISQLSATRLAEIARIQKELEDSGVTAQINDLSEQLRTAEGAKTILELGITPLQAIEILKTNGIAPVLTESDKAIFVHPRDYSSKDSLITVHKTKYAPTDSVIRTAKDSNAQVTKEITINGVSYSYSYTSGRDTVHTAMNDEVSSHMYGSWEDCPYSVMVPFKDIPNEKVGRAAPMDTFTRGNLDLTENSWILCPANEVEQIKAQNPNVNVLGYEGDSVLGYSQPFLTQLGYRAEDVGMWSWQDEESSRQFGSLVEKEGLKVGTHSFTYFHEDEELLTNVNRAVSLCNLLRDNNLLSNPKEIPGIASQLTGEHSFEAILRCIAERTGAKEDLEPQSIKGNGKGVEVFLDEMQKNGFVISPVYQEVLRNFCSVASSGEYSNIDQDKIFTTTAKPTEEQLAVIEQLKNSFKAETYNLSDETISAFGEFVTTTVLDSVACSQERVADVNNVTVNAQTDFQPQIEVTTPEVSIDIAQQEMLKQQAAQVVTTQIDDAPTA